MTRYININKIKIYYKGQYIRIKYHPYYIALMNNSKNQYEQCIANSEQAQQLKPTATWEGIQDLINIIKIDGFNLYKDSFDLFKKHNKKSLYSRHGRHRLCILLYLYGYNLSFKVKNNKNIYSILKLKLN
jgi:hypothetical protein